jgi:putative DNA primase/helicase
MISEVPDAWKNACIKEQLSPDDWERVRPRGSGPTICEEHGISMSDVLTLPAGARKVEDGYLIKHPIHDATGDGNLFVNTKRDLWCCYRHNTGGDPLTWVAVREGFISCEDAGPLDKETVLRVYNVLRREGLIPDNKPTVIEPDGSAITIEVRGCDDIANAERFCSKYDKTLRYCTETGKWLEFNGRYWEEISTTAIKHRAREVVTIIRYEAAEAGRLTGNETDEQRKKKQRIADELTRWARQSSFKVRLDALIDRAKGYLEISALKFDTNPLIVNCENGTYDIPTGELRPFHDPEDYCTLIAGPYIKGAKNAKWEAFKKKVQPTARVRAFLKLANGYSATALTNEEALFYCFGGPQTGKSTFLEATRSAMGSYGKGEPFSTFLLRGDGSQSRARPELLRLIGSRFVRCIEVDEKMVWDSSLLNTLVSGELMSGRPLFSNNVIEFIPAFKLWVAANHRAKVRYNPEEKDGFWRRLYVIPFMVEIPEKEQDKGLKSYFMNDPDAKTAILAEILEGATEWYQLSDGGRVNGLQAPDEILAARVDYEAAQSPIYEFLKNECWIGDEYRVPIADLWDAFNDARKGYNTKKVKSPVSLGLYLKGLGFGKDKVNNVRYATGLRLLDINEEPDEAFSFCTSVQVEGKIPNDSNESISHEGEIKKQGSTCTLVQDQAELMQTIRETMIEYPNDGRKPSRDYFVAVIAAQIQRRYPQFVSRNIEVEINRLNESDSGIQAILAERTEG